MIELNRRHSAAPPVHAATDVTGFGLLGHLLEMAQGAGLGFTLHSGEVPLLDGVLELAQRDCVPGGTKANLRAAEDAGVRFAGRIDEPLRFGLSDAQTSGGLLIAVAPAYADELRGTLKDAGVTTFARVGTMHADAKCIVE
jgi:selenide,water dikinase